MGTFTVRFAVAAIEGGGPGVELEGLVDTGATMPLIPEDVLRSLGVSPLTERIFTLADGSRQTLPVGPVWLSYGGYSAPCLVVFAPRGTMPLFGALALESLGLEVDPINRRLKPGRFYLAPALRPAAPLPAAAPSPLP